jgi:NitT/TauT family transport system ATP-binding protein
MHALEVKNVSHWFGTNLVLHNVNLQVAAGQIVSMVGPSGCGKSTLLRAILGTHPPREGTIYAEDKLVDQPTRDVGIVYQHYSLYDFLTAQQNVAIGLMFDQTSLPFRFFHFFKWASLHKRHLQQAAELLENVDLGDAVRLYPGEMSGGMRQRVAIAQALIMRPKILLLDEPFGALDEATREELQVMLLSLYQENLQAKQDGQSPPHTILIVTHELNEALYVADRVVGLSQYHAEGNRGATIVYDKAAPVFRPDDPKDVANFLEQKEELRKAVFDPRCLQKYQEYVSFWKDQGAVPRSSAADET